MKKELFIQAHLLVNSPIAEETVEATFQSTSLAGDVIRHKTPQELIKNAPEGLQQKAGFCIIEESSLTGITKKQLNQILGAPGLKFFLKTTDGFHLNHPDPGMENSLFFLDIAELSPTFIELFSAASDHEFQSRQLKSGINDLKMKQAAYVHEMRNPLAVIHGKCHNIMRNIPQSHRDDPWVISILNDCKKVMDCCTKIKGIGDVAFEELRSPKQSSGNSTLPIDEYQLEDIIWSSMEEAAAGFEVSVEIIDSVEPVAIRCHRQSFEGAIINLLKNAYEAIRSQDYPWIKIVSRADNNIVTLRVIDSGHGISNAESIFEPFFTTKQKEGGKGIGLQVVKTYFNGFGGNIKYLKDENGNTCFEIRFPTHI